MSLNKALFLDRDGVINIDHGYVHERENFDFVDGIFELVAAARELNYKIIIITNQAGIARGFYTEAQFHELMNWLKTKLPYDAYYFCPHHPDEGCNCRKPKAGMVLQAQAEHGIDLSQSLLIGDRETDIGAAKNAGIATKILFNSSAETAADFTIKNLLEAKKFL